MGRSATFGRILRLMTIHYVSLDSADADLLNYTLYMLGIYLVCHVLRVFVFCVCYYCVIAKEFYRCKIYNKRKPISYSHRGADKVNA